MEPRLAILAGTGALPQILAAGDPQAVFVTFAGVDVDVPATLAHLPAAFDRLGTLFDGLHDRGVTEVVFAGAMSRPALNPANFDAKMMALAPRLMAAMGQGDDALLREVAAVFTEEGFIVKAAHEVAPDLMLPAETRIGPVPDKQDVTDAQKGLDILAVLAPMDVSQAAVVAGGQVLGIETIQGTDAMLGFVAQTPAHLRRAKGVLVKGPKPGQDMRFDVPTIGPDTVRAAATAGLAGIYIPAGGVNVLQRDAVEQVLAETGLFLHAR